VLRQICARGNSAMQNRALNSIESPTYDYAIESFGNAISEAYVSLFSEAPEKLDDLNWRFGRGAQESTQFAVAREAGGRIVGMIALVSSPLRGGLGTVAAVQAIDTVVNPLVRGKSIFVRLGNLVHSSPSVNAQLVWGFPNALAARGWFGRLGWSRVGSVPFLIKPLRTGYFLGRLWRPLRRLNLPLCFRKPSYDEGIVNTVDERWNDLWNACVNDFGLAVDRTARWLRWRLDKPGADYKFAMKVGPEGAEAAVISRIVERHGAKICYVMEALSTPKHHKALSTLLSNELRSAAQQGAEVALAWCPKFARSRSNYAAVGFVGLPDRFRQIEIHFGGRWLSLDPDRSEQFPGATWYLSYLDSDTV
jgi:hypothetical protein